MNTVFSFSRRHPLELAACLTFGVFAAASATADTEELGDCLEQVAEIKHTSDFVKVEYLSVSQNGDPSFEIETRDSKGREWEFMCEADDGCSSRTSRSASNRRVKS